MKKTENIINEIPFKITFDETWQDIKYSLKIIEEGRPSLNSSIISARLIYLFQRISK